LALASDYWQVGKFLKETIRFVVNVSDGYHQVLSSITNNKKALKENAKHIITSIDKIVITTKIKAKKACQFYGVSKDWYYREKNKIKCELNIFKNCFKQFPTQLSFKESNCIGKFIFLPENFGHTKTTLYYKMLRLGLVFCGKSTFMKYTDGYGYRKPKRIPKIQKKGLKAS